MLVFAKSFTLSFLDVIKYLLLCYISNILIFFCPSVFLCIFLLFVWLSFLSFFLFPNCPLLGYFKQVVLVLTGWFPALQYMNEWYLFLVFGGEAAAVLLVLLVRRCVEVGSAALFRGIYILCISRLSLLCPFQKVPFLFLFLPFPFFLHYLILHFPLSSLGMPIPLLWYYGTSGSVVFHYHSTEY